MGPCASLYTLPLPAANQVDIESEEVCCEHPAAWPFRNAASRPVPHLLAPYMSQAEYSGALAGVNRAIDESPGDCCVRTETIRRIDDALAPFRQKGLEAQYIVGDGGDGYGNGRRKSRIRVTVPSTVARSLGPTAPPFTVKVPPNGCAGQMMQVQAPNGVTVQVQIPPGSVAGSRIQVAMPVPAGGTVPPGRAEMQRPDMMPQGPGWFWQESDGTWIPYSQRDSEELDRVKASGRPNAIVAGVYKVDFRTMTQTNTRTRFQRPVWCSDGNAQAGAVEAAAVVVAVH